ncbi:MAG: protein-L-isoaspartate(D-aspartate) O-methyltransferase, partial [Planctomycetaceae bacterium]
EPEEAGIHLSAERVVRHSSHLWSTLAHRSRSGWAPWGGTGTRGGTGARLGRGVTLAIGIAMAALAGVLDLDSARGQAPDKTVAARERMVQLFLEDEGVKHPRVLEAMRTVPRHLFVPQPQRGAAYNDQALPIGHKQTISPPFIVGYMTEMLDPQPDDRVLEIGTGSGYQAAVLAQVVKEVYTIEIVEPLGRTAARVLGDLKYTNVFSKVGDGYQGWPDKAPFDKIIVTCSPEDVPQALIEQLKDGGKMIIPIGERYDQAFFLLEKQGGELVRRKLLPVLFVPMTGDSEKNRKVLPNPAKPELRNGGFELENDGVAESWYYQRNLARKTDDAPEGSAFVEFESTEPGRSAQLLQGMGVDGSKVAGLQFSLRVRAREVKPGQHPDERAVLRVHFYDADRRELPAEGLGPWEGTFDWKRVSRLVTVPPRAREAIVRIGLCGATGTLAVDDVQMKVVPR